MMCPFQFPKLSFRVNKLNNYQVHKSTMDHCKIAANNRSESIPGKIQNIQIFKYFEI